MDHRTDPARQTVLARSRSAALPLLFGGLGEVPWVRASPTSGFTRSGTATKETLVVVTTMGGLAVTSGTNCKDGSTPMLKPDLVIGPEDDPYMLRWHLFRWRGWQLALHKIRRSDDDRALHDHSGDNLSIILRGQYTEMPERRVFGAGNTIFRKAEKPHRLVLNDDSRANPVWTLWFRWPPRRQWGFHCPGRGWVHWREFIGEDYATTGKSPIGRGCG